MDLHGIANLAIGLLQTLKNVTDHTMSPSFLSSHGLLVFQKFKKAYESKNIAGVEDIISEDFRSDVYGNKKDFIALITTGFSTLWAVSSPYLVIDVLNISKESEDDICVVIDMQITIKLLGIPTPLTWDSGKLSCRIQPEGKLNFWRITELMRYRREN